MLSFISDNVKDFAVAQPAKPWSKSKKVGSLTQESDRTALLNQIKKLPQSRDGNACIFFASTFSNYLSNVQALSIFLSEQRTLPKWQRELSESSTKTFILLELVDKMAGEVQTAVERENHKPFSVTITWWCHYLRRRLRCCPP